jgi:hypothetical protein
MKDIKENISKVSIFLSTEINEIFTKTTINKLKFRKLSVFD